jgi:hypothetical protein
MAKFEVFIPPAEPGGFNVTFKVDANNWMSALKIGMLKLGQQGANAQNILVDIQDDNSVHVTESESGRVFRIRELTEQEAAEAKPKPGAKPEYDFVDDRAETPKEMPAIGAEPTPPEPAPAAVLEPIPQLRQPPHPGSVGPHDAPTVLAPSYYPQEVDARVAQPVPTASPPQAEMKKTLPGIPLHPAQPATPRPGPISKMRKSAIPTRAGTQELMPKKVIELEKPTRPISGAIGRSKPPRDKKAELEDVLSEVFERVREVYGMSGPDNALYFLLDLALEKIPAESGSVFRADPATGNLTFWAARGPKAKDLLDARIVVPAGSGIVGFCATEGVSVALSDVMKDPRYFAAVSNRVNYETKSVLCSPMMTHGRTFGAMQIINKRDGAVFAEHEVGLLSYVAHQGALYLNSVV